MKNFYVLFLIGFLSFPQIKAQNLTERIAQKFCQELSNADTLSVQSFEKLLPEIENKVLLEDTQLIKEVADEVKERNITYLEFYTQVFNTFSKTCPSYQSLFKEYNYTLKDPEYFVNSYCGCFNEVTGGEIENEDMGSVLEECNQRFDNNRKYKRKVRRELRNKELSETAFSNIITGNFLTQCDLIIDHFFSFRANLLSAKTQMVVLDMEK